MPTYNICVCVCVKPIMQACFFFLSLFALIFSAFGCPYSDINVKKEVVLPDRLGGEKQIAFVPVHFVQKTKRLFAEDQAEDEVQEEETHLENR